MTAASRGGAAREELFDKLHTFFKRYFCESGSIYFRHLPVFSKTYERVYEYGQDVALSWKTKMLYYVKSDVLLHSMPVELESGSGAAKRFYFDASKANGKKNNEKKEFVFSFLKVTGGESDSDESEPVVHLGVSYSQNGVKSKLDDIVKAANKERRIITIGSLQDAIAVFRRQTEVDFFINKDARGFLREQFDLWTYQYLFSGETVFEQERLEQLQAIRDTAYDIIDFIAQFEDELARIWNKPKFVKSARYVVTLDRLAPGLAQKIKKHTGYADQVKEWRALGIDKNNPKAPIDTRFFKDLEIEILAQFDNLDECLDGWLIKSENYQALKTILPKFHGKVQTIYIDPPFNTGDDFPYMDKFQDGTWLTFMLDRFELAQRFLSESGHFYLQLDHYADYLGRMLLAAVFPNSSTESQAFITWNTGSNISGFKIQRNNWIRQADKIMFFPKNPAKSAFTKLWSPLDAERDKKIGWLDFIGEDNENLYIERWDNGKLARVPVKVKSKRIGTVWNDIYSFQYSEPRETESFSFATQKPENLLRRMIQSCSDAGDIILDFFSGIGTTAAVAQKLGRKWVAVECGDHIDNFYVDKNDVKKVGVLGRLKIVLSNDAKFTLPNTAETRNPHLTKDLNWQGGGFFKYYELEQYEEALTACRTYKFFRAKWEKYVVYGTKISIRWENNSI